MYRTRARSLATACALAATAALALAGCGLGSEGGEAGGAAAEAPRAERPASAGRAAAEQPPHRLRQQRRAPLDCRAQTRRLLAAMEALRDRLVAGLDYRAYLEQMRGLRAAYEELPVERLPLACLDRVAAPAERGLNRYIEALNVWAGCVEEPGCQAVSVEVPLQRRWRDAARELAEARRALR